MIRALAGHDDVQFAEPPGIVSVEIDRDTGKIAGPLCPRVFKEAFLAERSRRRRATSTNTELR